MAFQSVPRICYCCGVFLFPLPFLAFFLSFPFFMFFFYFPNDLGLSYACVLIALPGWLADIFGQTYVFIYYVWYTWLPLLTVFACIGRVRT